MMKQSETSRDNTLEEAAEMSLKSLRKRVEFVRTEIGRMRRE